MEKIQCAYLEGCRRSFNNEQGYYQHIKDEHKDPIPFNEWKEDKKKEKNKNKRSLEFPCNEVNCDKSFETKKQCVQHRESSHQIYEEENFEVDPGFNERVRKDLELLANQFTDIKKEIIGTSDKHVTNIAKDLLRMMENLMKLALSLDLKSKKSAMTWGGTVVWLQVLRIQQCSIILYLLLRIC